MEPSIGSEASAIPNLYGHRAVHDILLEYKDVARLRWDEEVLQAMALQLGHISLLHLVVVIRHRRPCRDNLIALGVEGEPGIAQGNDPLSTASLSLYSLFQSLSFREFPGPSFSNP